MDAAMQETEQKKIDELQLVSFCLGNEEYGVDILKVQEIIRMLTISRIPEACDYVEGMINLRGRVIPLINLRTRFGLEKKELSKQNRIIVVNIDGKLLGIVVDSVSEVLRLPMNTIEPPPSGVSGKGTEYIKGVGKMGDKLLVLLELEKLFHGIEIEALGLCDPAKTLPHDHAPGILM